MKHKTKNQIFHEKKKLMPDKNLIEFDKRKKSIPDKNLIQLCKEAIKKMCNTGGKAFTMTVPVKIEDTDIILSELVERFEKSINSQPTPDERERGITITKAPTPDVKGLEEDKLNEDVKNILIQFHEICSEYPVSQDKLNIRAVYDTFRIQNILSTPKSEGKEKCPYCDEKNGSSCNGLCTMNKTNPQKSEGKELDSDFKCYEIHRPNIPQFGCTKQCKECKAESEGKERKLPTDKEIRERYDYLNESKAFQMIENNKSYWEYAAQWMRHKADRIIKSLD